MKFPGRPMIVDGKYSCYFLQLGYQWELRDLTYKVRAWTPQGAKWATIRFLSGRDAKGVPGYNSSAEVSWFSEDKKPTYQIAGAKVMRLQRA
jgi:hypothetical protein